ncbi:MAG: hypothetical protein HY782_17380 [Chloroflexi bacterium]|nr:hypothetical protein [Chloroflexota bacterium]
MFILLTVLILFAIFWFVVKPRWMPGAPDAAAWMDKASRASKQATAKAGQMYKGMRGRFKFRSDTRELAKQFKQWVADAALPKRAALSNSLPAQTESFAAWLGGLADEELEQFTAKVAQYCATVNFDLAWLNDPQVNREPELKQAVEDAVLMYSLGAWRADSVQQDVRVFMAYRAWRADPQRHKEFGQQLHQVLIERGLATVPSELYLAPEKERLANATSAICEVADENPAAFHLALRQLASAPESVPPTAPATAVIVPTSVGVVATQSK